MGSMAAFYPMISLISMIAFAWLGRRMAIARQRNGLGWGIAGALFPPILLILKFLNEKREIDAAGDEEVDIT
mgnify:CR=1 FL=1|tara:strand:- start:904 stop:1119 length:216 start_codon:yes stop_codon:yes gene_type:complete